MDQRIKYLLCGIVIGVILSISVVHQTDMATRRHQTGLVDREVTAVPRRNLIDTQDTKQVENTDRVKVSTEKAGFVPHMATGDKDETLFNTKNLIQTKDTLEPPNIDHATVSSETGDNMNLIKFCRPDQRAEYVREMCKDMTKGNITAVGSTYVDDKHKLLFCHMGKVASGTMLHYFGKINAGDNYDQAWGAGDEFLKKTGMRTLKQLSAAERDNVFKTYFKFVIVRHPFDRLISAYRNRVGCTGCRTGWFDIRFSRFIPYLEAIDKNVKSGSNITMEHFLYLLNTKYNDDDDIQGFRNGHWAPFHQVCAPCEIPYDYIFRFENFDSDMEWLYKQLESTMSEVPRITAGRGQGRGSRNAVYFEKMRQASDAFKPNTPETLKGVMDVYGKDMKLFGYNWDDKSGATCKSTTANGEICC